MQTSIRESSNPAGRHAVVVGGSMAGLVAARVLADHYERVTIVERDRFPSEPAFRKGVPQSHHVHVLLGSGVTQLETFLPGLRTELIEAGAVPVHWPLDVLWMLAPGWAARHDRGIDMISCSRELLEWSVRRRVLAIENIECREGRNVTGLQPSDDASAITGIRYLQRGLAQGADNPPEYLRADLVVDASGRNSHAPAWLEELGYPAPREEKINSFLGYATRYFRRPEHVQTDWKVIFLQTNPPHSSRMGALFPIEGGRWVATVAGAGRDYPPTDDEGYMAFARSLRSPVFYDAIRDAEPLSPIRGYQRTENQMRHYERLRRFPERFIVLGDAVCAFNPIYGQGMSVAALQGALLDATLKERPGRQPDGNQAGLSLRFQKRIAKQTADAWLIATGEDLRYPTTEGGAAGPTTRLMHRYLDRVTNVATQDVRVSSALGQVINLLQPPTSLFRPTVLLPVLRGVKHVSDPDLLPAMPSINSRLTGA